MSVEEIVINKTANFFRVEEKSLTPLTSLNKDLNADSLDVLELAMDIQEFYDIEFESEELENVNTIQDVVSVVNNYVQ